jgi:hypothetical protein
MAEDTDRRLAVITFVPRDANLALEETFEGKAVRRISMGIDLESDVRLPDDRSIKNLPWTIYFLERHIYNEFRANEEAIGVLTHSGEMGDALDYFPETCHINAALKPEKFSTLLSVLQDGRLPSRIRVTVRGIGYGWEPDGALWDVKSMQTVPVVEVEFTIPLIAPREGPVDLRSLEQTLGRMFVAARTETGRRWMTLVVLLIVAVLLLYFRR